MNSNKVYLEIQNDVLFKCNSKGEDKVVIPEGVEIIGDLAFFCCESLKSIKIPNSVKSYGYKPFYGCKNLENINIPKCVTKIGLRMFEGCKSLKCNQIDKTQKKILAYKGFDSNLSCRGFKYKVGETYHEDKAKVCWCGFHACLNPLDVLAFYPNENGNRFALVELSGTIDFNKNFGCDDSKIAATDIKIIKELTFQDLIAEFNRLNK